MKIKTFYPHTRLDAQDLNDLSDNQVKHDENTAASFSTGILYGLTPSYHAEHNHVNHCKIQYKMRQKVQLKVSV